jgi:hypothetical protein
MGTAVIDQACKLTTGVLSGFAGSCFSIYQQPSW